MRSGDFGLDSPASNKRDASLTPKSLLQLAVRSDDAENKFTNIPPLRPNELEFFVDNPLKFKPKEQIRSPKKTVGPFSFDLLVFPSGNSTSYSTNPKMAVYVECVDVASKDDRWVFQGVRFSVSAVNFLDYRKSLYNDDTHTFTSVAVDRGWPELLSLSEIQAPGSGWLNSEGKLCIRASVCCRQADTILMTSEYKTRQETGFIGLKNHGATCYLNGLLQSYFHLGKFRQLVYRMIDPQVQESGAGSPGTRMSLPLALQSVFLRLEKSETPVNCSELIRAFGWDSMDAFTQHDVQELARILCDRLEDKLKEANGPDGAKPLQSLFEGKIENYIECVDIDYKSSKIESVYDIPVNVRDQTGTPLGSLENALCDFTSVELLSGDNAYEAEGFSEKQVAKKGIRFVSFPPILSFQLKRFSFDFERMDNVKLHDRFSFPTRLVCGNENTPYVLHTVLVHSGDVNSGHYYAFVRTNAGVWHRFDDEQVSTCSEYAAVDDNFGGEDVLPCNYWLGNSPIVRPRIHSAYMLVYILESHKSDLLASPQITEVQDRVLAASRRIDERKRIHEEAKQMVTAVVHSESDLVGLCGFGCSDKKFWKSGKEIKINRETPVCKLTDTHCEDTVLFYWKSGKWTLMPQVKLSSGSLLHTSPKYLFEDVSKAGPDSLHAVRDFLIDDDEIHVLAISKPQFGGWTEASPFVLIWLKKFIPETPAVVSIGVFCVHRDTRVSSVLPEGPDEWLVFEEGGDSVEIAGSFAANRIETGTVLIFQNNTIAEAETEESDDEQETFPMRTVLDYARAIDAEIKVAIYMHDVKEKAHTDLCAVDGQAPNVQTVDGRWSLKMLMKQLLRTVDAEMDHCLHVFENPATACRDPPICTSDDAGSARVGACKHVDAHAWNLHLLWVPRNCVCVRVFDANLIEQNVFWIPAIGVCTVGEISVQCGLGDDREWQLVIAEKGKIVSILQSDVCLNLAAHLAGLENVSYAYLRLEPRVKGDTVWVSHMDRQSGVFFGCPFAIPVGSGPVYAKSLKNAIIEKLKTSPFTEKWRLCTKREGKVIHFIDEDLVPDKDIILEQNHPDPNLIGAHKYTAGHHKQLTIR